MANPTIQLIPSRAAVCSDQDVTLEVLIKITPPASPTPSTQSCDRPPLNLGLVIDRSGSMEGEKIEYARQAACFAVEELIASDFVSVTIFDSEIETLVPTMPVQNKRFIQQQISMILPRGATALHQGWVNGAVQVNNHLQPQFLNRVLLLSDGLANRGKTNPDQIAQDVHDLQQRGISTTTLGVGVDYDEDLLAAMARSGDGNFYHIESPADLQKIFDIELQGLMATVGRGVSLGIEPQAQVNVTRIFNKLEKNQADQFLLPNLAIGHSIHVLLQLKVSAIQATSTSQPICDFHLAWDDPNQSQRQQLEVSLNLPVVSQAEWEALPQNREVQGQVVLFLAAHARQEAIHHADEDDWQEVDYCMESAEDSIAFYAHSFASDAAMDPSLMDLSEDLNTELTMLKDLKADLDNKNIASMRKKMRSQSENKFLGKKNKPNV